MKPTTAQAVPRHRPRRTLAPYAFLAPFLIPFVLFSLVPIGYAFWQSLHKTQRTGGTFGRTHSVFAGFDQYVQVVQEPYFAESVLRVAGFALVQIPVMLLLSLVLALLLDSAVARAKRFFRLVYFVPYGIPGVVAALMWAFLYDPRLSPLVDALDSAGIHADLLGPGAILWSIGNVVTWTYTGYNMLILYAALQAVPADIGEAARVDGAGGWAIALRIKIPIIRPALILTGVFSIIGTFQLFTEPQVFRSISTSVTSAYTPNLAAYSLASGDNYGEAAALSVLLAVVTFALSFAFLRFTSRRQG
ncbi:carbohydrate ABC transporter permease [Streptomyces triticiradicis]|uniref:Sugar ABC transporter permease n=1 Tax=Streptomyces triticiradicis TaxID=2651189 RepID=A0A7J5D354_9ACTN|nr:sugar ABC transporter permease [Streptomyces triticiradicis]KAB1977764.1 sugar ABC transporter permease [Streptomyces triticiradicis]